MTTTAGPITFAGILDGSLLQKQIEMEAEAAREGAERYRRLVDEAVERGHGATLKPAEQLILHWLPNLISAIRKEQKGVARGEFGMNRSIYGPLLLQVDARRIAFITLHEMINKCLISAEGYRSPSLCYAVGQAIVAEACYDRMKEDNSENLKKLTEKCHQMSTSVVIKWAKKCLSDPLWNKRVCAHLGSAVIWLAVVTCVVKQEDGVVLGFRRINRMEGKKKKGYVQLTRPAFKLLEKGHVAREVMRPSMKPMVVEPLTRKVMKSKNGIPQFTGGYITLRTPLIAKATHAQRMNVLGHPMKEAMEGLDAIQRTPWRVNTRVLDALQRVYRQFGGGVCGMPRSKDTPIPPRPPECDNDKKLHREWCKRASLIHQANANARGDRFNLEHQFVAAEEFRDFDRLWMPHHFDFRGRVYPEPDVLHHHKGDVARSLLLFGNAKKSNQDDARWWIYVHAANCAGRDKLSYGDRVKWADEWIKSNQVHTWIGDQEKVCSAVKSTWGASDIEDPCQFLAAIMSIFNQEMASKLPVQLDATCSALQHFSAMALDAETAAHVNLLDSNAPNKIYWRVADRMEALRRKDAEKGPEQEMAKLAEGLIDTSMAKSPTMTTSYGATNYGIHEQIFERLGEFVDLPGREYLKQYKARHALSRYLRKLANEAIAYACPSATTIMRWIKEQARKIAEAGFAVEWESPVGFPVIQAYRRTKRLEIKTVLQRLYYDLEPEHSPVMVAKQARAAAPNVVHSFDAAHGLRWAGAAKRAGIDTGLVHDCFWQHAANVDESGVIIREKFIEQYQENQLQNLYVWWRHKFRGVAIDPPPEQVGTLDLSNVMGAKYMVS